MTERQETGGFDDTEWKVLCTACGENPWFFNVASLHCEWTGGRQDRHARGLWYRPLRSLVGRHYIRAYVTHFAPTKNDPNLMNILHEDADSIDFRRRMAFRATRRGWAAYRKEIQGGRRWPALVANGGHWVVETESGAQWKEDMRGKRIE